MRAGKKYVTIPIVNFQAALIANPGAISRVESSLPEMGGILVGFVASSYSGDRYLFNFHIGVYQNADGSICYVVWQNQGTPLCWKTCSGESGLRALLYRAIKTSAFAVGVVIGTAVAWTLASMAAATAAPMLVP